MKKASLLLLTFFPVIALLAGLSGLQAPAAVSAAAPALDSRLAAFQQEGPIDPEPPLITLGGEATAAAEPDAMATASQAAIQPAWASPYAADKTTTLAWGDYDLDGDLDLVMGGQAVGSSTEQVRLYRNTGGSLQEVPVSLKCETGEPENNSSVAWGDPNQDGYLDLAIGNNGGLNCIYLYTPGSGSFKKAWWADHRQNTTSVAWAGWSTGSSFSTYLAVGNVNDYDAIYRYEAGTVDIWWTSPENLNTYDLAWGDYNNDGLPDLATANFGEPSVIYKNVGSNLVKVFATPEGRLTTSIAWGDMNGDGYLDLALGNGYSSGTYDPDQVYCNTGPDGDYNFEKCWTSQEKFATTDVAWGDVDSDGDLDLAAASKPGGPTRIYLNEGGTLLTSAGWNAGDATSESTAVAWADWDRDGDLEFTIGYYQKPSVVYENLLGPLYPFDLDDLTQDTRSVAWGDWDNDGDLDLALGNSSGKKSQVYENDAGVLTEAWTSYFADNTRSVAWGDMNGDGYLDLAVGNGEENSAQPNWVYLNDGDGLSDIPYFLFMDVHPGDTHAVAWGDYDGDQDLDLAAANYGTGQYNHIYINRDGVFTETVALGPLADRSLSLAWGDFDQDYDLDLAVGNYDGPSRVYVNDGQGGFSNVALPAPSSPCPMDGRSVAWADWDGDGDLDLAVGNSGRDGCVQILSPSGSGGSWSFTQVWQSSDSGLDVRSMDWGDYDGDGDDDLAVGVTGQFGLQNLIYQNNNNGSMKAVTVTAVEDSDPTRSVAWGDYDGDGDLDLAVGNSGATDKPSRVYQNNWTNSTNLANDPTSVVIERPGVTGDAAHFSMHEIVGKHILPVEYYLLDDEGDRAFLIEPQVSWDGGGSWEPALQAPILSDGVMNLASSPDGTFHMFGWSAMEQLLAHQGIPFDPKHNVYVPQPESFEEMDVVFRIKVWANPEHGGLIQRPYLGTATDPFRLDVRPDWSDSAKTAPETVHPGELLEYTIAITQTDHGLPPGQILDILPPELILEQEQIPAMNQSLGRLEWTTNTITWTGHIDYEEPYFEINFKPRVALPLPNGMEIDNCANIYDGMHAPFDRCTTVVISSTPQLDSSWKWVNGLTENVAEPGDVLTYTLVLTNTGTDNARTVTLTDKLSPDLVWLNEAQATSGQLAFDAGALSWQGVVNVFHPVTITYLAQVALPLPGNSVITNTFTVDDGINPAFTAEPVTTTVIGPDLRESYKTTSPEGPVELADTVHYSLYLKNTGDLPAQGAQLVDPIPVGAVYVPNSLTYSSGAGAYNPASKAVTWSGGIPSGAEILVEFDVRVAAPLAEKPVLKNTATLTDPQAGEVALVAQNPITLPKLSGSVKTAAPAEVEIGDTITYTIVLKNTGGNAPQVTLNDPLPAQTTYIPNSLTFSAGTASVTGGNQVTWSGSLAPEEIVTLTFAVVVGAPLTADPQIVNVATVEEPASGPYTLQAVTTLRLPNLTTSTKTATPNAVELGDTLTYTIQIHNEGGNAPGLSLVDRLAGVGEYVTGSCALSQGTGGFQVDQNAVTWQGDLLSGESASVQFNVIAGCPADGVTKALTNVAQLRDSANVILNPQASTYLALPDLSTSTFKPSADRALPGDKLTYTLTLRNTGGKAPLVTVRDILPVGLVWTNVYQADGGALKYEAATRMITWEGAMTGDSAVTITFEVMVSPNADSYDNLLNTAVVSNVCAESSLKAWVNLRYNLNIPLVQRRAR